MLRDNLEAVRAWLDNYGSLFEYVPPQGGGMFFVKYNLNINSTELARWLREEQSVFIVAGDCYGLDNYIRIGIGTKKEYILEGLDRVKDALSVRFGV